MLVRNEGWILRATIDAALKWCDGLAIVDDDSSDDTAKICESFGDTSKKHIEYFRAVRTGEHWLEMRLRQHTLDMGREMGGTHFAIIDADEILTANLVPTIRNLFDSLQPGQVLDLPMVCCWKSFDKYAIDIQSIVTLGFVDAPNLCWETRGEEKYEYHNRPPKGFTERLNPPVEGGVFHLQFASWSRLVWKHRNYMLSEKVRWNYTDAEINSKYHWFEDRGNVLADVPDSWWGNHNKSAINLEADSWFIEEVHRLAHKHGKEIFAGLDLFGWKP